LTTSRDTLLVLTCLFASTASYPVVLGTNCINYGNDKSLRTVRVGGAVSRFSLPAEPHHTRRQVTLSLRYLP
jgi:hypothetical protein